MLNNLFNNARLKSLLWRTGMMALAFLATAAAAHLDVLKLSVEQTAFLGLILGEISKAINTKSENNN